MTIAPGHAFRDVPTTLVELDRTLARVTREFQARIGNHQSQLARMLNVKPQTVQSWFNQGRVSPWGAIEIGKRYSDFPKERLRPDIQDWKGIKLRTPGRV